jgi:hypothetical protein
MGHPARVWFVSVFLAAVGACGSTAAPPKDAAVDAPSPDVADHPYQQVADCAEPDAGVLPSAPPSCAGPVQSCSSAGADSCLFTHLRASLLGVFKTCNLSCGEFAFAFMGGCATAVEPFGFTPPPGALDCLREHVVGTRWDCAPSDGWTRVYVGSCTLP